MTWRQKTSDAQIRRFPGHPLTCTTVPSKDAETVASTFMTSWICRFGVPKVLVTDNDPSFVNRVLNQLAAGLHIQKLTTTVYHPEGNAPIEAFHRVLGMGLRFLDHRRLPFAEALSLVMFGYRSTVHATTGQSPSFLLYGTDLRLAPDQDWRAVPPCSNQERLKFLSLLRLDVQFKAQELAALQNVKANRSRQPTEFEENQLVLCRAIPIDTIRYKVAFYKAVPRWTLPYRVIRVGPNKKTAVVKCLLTHTTRQVHIQDVRFVEAPQGELQAREWLDEVSATAYSMYNPEVADRAIREFFAQVETPQLTMTSPALARDESTGGRDMQP